MKFGNRSAVNEGPTDLRSFLGEGTDIVGEIKFTEIMRIDASVSGTISSDSGSLLIMERGQVKATIKAGLVEVSGTVEGTITAKTSVKIHPSGRVYGDIYTPALMIEHGAVFDGKCHMIDEKSSKNVNKPDPKLADLKPFKTADAV